MPYKQKAFLVSGYEMISSRAGVERAHPQVQGGHWEPWVVALAALFVNLTKKCALLSLLYLRSEYRCVPILLHRSDKFTVVFEAKALSWTGISVIFLALREQEIVSDCKDGAGNWGYSIICKTFPPPLFALDQPKYFIAKVIFLVQFVK